VNLHVSSAVNVTISEQCELFNRAFKGYIAGDAHFTPESFARFLGMGGIDLWLSQVVYMGDDCVGFALIARQGWTSRLAGMGVVPEAKGQGVGKWFMRQLVEQAQARGDQRFILEVFEQNMPAVRVYESVGFRVIERLIGYSLDNPLGEAANDFEDVDILDVARLLTQYSAKDLAWQASGSSLASIGPPNVGKCLDQAYIVISNPEQPTIRIWGIVTPAEYQNQKRAQRLIRALFAKYPGKQWSVPQICPETIGERVLEKVGFQCEELNQFHMAMDLTAN
jgi:ribosomal protein S18 acetylase RimI-like enzyme